MCTEVSPDSLNTLHPRRVAPWCVHDRICDKVRYDNKAKVRALTFAHYGSRYDERVVQTELLHELDAYTQLEQG